MKKLFQLFLIFSLFVLYSYATENDDTPSKDLIKLVEKYDAKYNSMPNIYYPQPQKTVSSDDISRGVDSTIYFSSPDSPIKIRKVFNPGNKTNYLLGDPIGVYVEISSTDKDLSDIAILEVIDDELNVLRISDEYGKISSIDSICDYYRDLNNDDFFGLESCINEETGCRMNLLNKSGVFFKENELECNLLRVNLSRNCNSSELNTILKIIKEEFNIPWAIPGSASCEKKMNSIKINRNNDLDFVDISYNISSNIAIVNISNQRFYKFKAEFKDHSIIINDTEIALNFNFNTLGKHDIFAYRYYIKPKKSGNFNTITLVRSYGQSDIKYISTIDIKEPNPQFEITPRPKDSELIRIFGPLDLAYDITYLGGASDPELNNAKIALENDTAFYICSFKGSDKSAKTMNFTKYKTMHVNTKVRFKTNGKISIPGIYINDKLYNFRDTTIEVYGLAGWLIASVTNYNFIFSALIASIIFVILIVTGKTPKEWIHRQWSVYRGKIKRNRWISLIKNNRWISLWLSSKNLKKIY